MSPIKLILQSLVHFRKRNALLALGFAVSTAVLTGALIVGDSVKYSLHRIVEYRLGKTSHIMQSPDRYFRASLPSDLESKLHSPVAGILLLDGTAVAGGGEKRINGVKVIGTDHSFDSIAGTNNFYARLQADSVIISSNLAERLNLGIGDDFLIRMKSASLVPLNAPFVSESGNSVSLRVTISAIAGAEELGTFNILNSQTPPFNIFISQDHLRSLMEIGDKSNILLFAGDKHPKQVLEQVLKNTWTLEDAGLSIRYDPRRKSADVKSDRIFIEDTISYALEKAYKSGNAFLTYFVNSIRHTERSTPYSFVSSLPDSTIAPNEIIINQWLAEDLSAKKGDTLQLKYFVVGPLRELTVADKLFVVKEVVAVKGLYADRSLMPDIPGMSDAGNCRDWETGVPIDLESIRDKDEDYWTRYKGTPKAFISQATAGDIWANRFGTWTSFRYTDVSANSSRLERSILRNIDPSALGFEIKAVRSQAQYAADNGVDFSQLFGGLSFFLLIGAILLSILLFRLNLEERKEQVMTLSSLGIPLRKIRGIMLSESMIVACIGGLFGLLLAVFYNRLIFHWLNGIWIDIVRTDMLFVHVKALSLVIGYIISVLIAWIALFTGLNTYLRKSVGAHFRKKVSQRSRSAQGIFSILGYVTGALALILIIYQITQGELVNAEIFFSAGALLLLSGILLIYSNLVRIGRKELRSFHLYSLNRLSIVANLSRSMSVVILLAIGTFIVLSTGSNKKDLFAGADLPDSGTGGFLYYGESTLPVLTDLNDPAVRYEFGLSDDYRFVQMRISDGDDASCLNLNRISNPAILGVDPSALKGRFSFVTSLPGLDPDDPWASLEKRGSGSAIPAVADETVIKWGLGMKVGDTLQYMDANGKILKLELVGGLAPSIFQGHVLISDHNFLKHFPASSGTNVFLVDGAMEDTARIKSEVENGMRDFGLSMEYSAQRLSAFSSVTNTYLSVFMILGALGLMLGTIGLSVLLYRTILERKSEIALLRAVGYSLKRIKMLLIREYALLLLGGIIVGSISSLVATLPSFISKNTDVSLITVLAILALLVLNGLFWIWLVSGFATRGRSLVRSLRNE